MCDFAKASLDLSVSVSSAVTWLPESIGVHLDPGAASCARTPDLHILTGHQ